MIDKQPLGRSALDLPALGLGCVTFGREIDEETSFRILDYAVERGVTLLDSAEAYGGGNARQGRRALYNIDDQREVSDEMHSSEKIIGRWIAGTGGRNGVTICTKVSSGASPQNIHRVVEACCQRLGTDRIDVLMLHSWDEAVPIGESLAALTEHVQAGRVGALGCSNFTGDQLGQSIEAAGQLGIAGFEVVQNMYNLVRQEEGRDLFSLCRAHEISFMAYSPLGAGFLTGKYTADRNNLPDGTRFHISPAHCDIYFDERGFGIIEQLREAAQSTGRSMVDLAMAWVTGCPDVSCTLLGARRPAHIDNAMAAYENGLDEMLRAQMADW